MPLGEAMFTQRAIRKLDPDRPGTDAQLEIMLDAASKAQLERGAPLPHPMGIPPRARFLVVAQIVGQIMEDAQIVEGMDVRRNELRHRADMRRSHGIGGDQGSCAAVLIR